MRAFRLGFTLMILLTSAASLLGQAGQTGTILGTVTDSTGAVMPGVPVTVTNTATNVAFRTVTSSSGDYQAPSLLPGPYSVTVTAKGFQKSVKVAGFGRTS